MIEYPQYGNATSVGITGCAFAVNYIINNLESPEQMTKVRDWAIELERNANLWIEAWSKGVNFNNVEPNAWANHLTQYIEANPIECFKMDSPHKKAFLLTDLGAWGYPITVLEDYYVQMMRLRDLFIKPKVNYVYMKLETGGLSGYISADRITGAKDYPILQVTWSIDNQSPEQIIIQHEESTLNKMSEWAIREHKDSGLWDKCLRSTVTLDDATNIIVDSFKQAGLVATNYQENTNIMLVSYSAGFVAAFLRNQMRRVNSYFHMQTIDVLKLTSYAMPLRKYNQVFVPALYSNNAVAYITGLRDFTNGMGYTK